MGATLVQARKLKKAWFIQWFVMWVEDITQEII